MGAPKLPREEAAGPPAYCNRIFLRLIYSELII